MIGANVSLSAKACHGVARQVIDAIRHAVLSWKENDRFVTIGQAGDWI
jgi:hypothetical protein